ncbi:core-2/I-Branching enzyme [Bacteroides intestinalis CAG:315]|jgi:hypothetical protein|uniref:Peptide O-xylosyltransferase n=1 Tax=Bacteroides intestinalis TaxID=329854 RepID=A0A412YM67_9BACE|nr:beta-1,6-N-acetylglucosaminyltransferase [Bacteroides intestinalis]RGV58462.1 glycosyl transferase [Bacteroides intestinalis]RHA63553.1 glycosyl transferase [Bacteroides intestinalis]CDD92275.1 core-2/I-Branching enzyme [Bacteroides intestinalis CAG:315]
MKHAYLIIAHNEYPVLRALLLMLDDERNDIFLHIDHRSMELYEKIHSVQMQRANLHILSTRNKVYWGDLSQVETEYLLLETASAKEAYSYYHLLSGTDLPIQTQDYIHSFFQINAGKEFVEYWSGNRHQKDLKRKISRYYFFTKHLKRNNSKWHVITAPCHNLALIVQKMVHFNRKQEVEFRKGSQWFSITHNFCLYLLEKKPFVLRRFRYTLCPDEIFVQTLLWNSSFKKNIYNIEDNNIGSMRLIDWNRGDPYTWKIQDYTELVNSDKLFARKFSSQEEELIKLIKSTY